MLRRELGGIIIIIRRARIEDKNDVVKLYEELDTYHRENVKNTFKVITKGYREEFFVEALNNQDVIFIVAEEDCKVVGFINDKIFNIIDNPMLLDKKMIKIEDLVVNTNYRRKGIAESLFEHTKNIVKEMGVNSIELGVYEFNNAKYFYEKIGFEPLIRRLKLEL